MKRLKKNGFTLVELLIAIAIMGTITVAAVKSLYDILTIRAKEQTLEDSSESLRTLIQLVSISIQEAQYVSVVNSNEVRIVGPDSCKTIRFDSVAKVVTKSETLVIPCVPPTTDFKNITRDDFVITSFSFSPIQPRNLFVNMEIEGFYRNSLGDHPVSYQTSITPRI